jgi:hypothetical protein
MPQDHPLRSLRAMTDEALRDLQPRFNKLYAKTRRPSIAPEKLLRALLLQVLYSVRSERMLMEQLDYNLSFGDVPIEQPLAVLGEHGHIPNCVVHVQAHEPAEHHVYLSQRCPGTSLED